MRAWAATSAPLTASALWALRKGEGTHRSMGARQMRSWQLGGWSCSPVLKLRLGWGAEGLVSAHSSCWVAGGELIGAGSAARPVHTSWRADMRGCVCSNKAAVAVFLATKVRLGPRVCASMRAAYACYTLGRQQEAHHVK